MKKFKELSNGKKILVAIVGIGLLPFTLALLSATSLLRNMKNKNKFKALISGICLVFSFALMGSVFGSDEGQETINDSANNVISETNISSNAEEVKDVEEDTSVKGIATKVAQKAMGDSFISVEYSDMATDGVVVIKGKLKDNFTNNMMIRGAYMDVEKICKQLANDLKDHGIVEYDFWFVSTLVDAYGNESEDKVLSFDYKTEDLEKINWDNMYTDKFMELANNEWIHPALRD